MRKTILTLMCLVAMMAAGVGLKAQEITITLDPGWNWISYPNAVAMEVDEALATFAPMEGDVVKGAYGFSVYHQGRWVGGLTHFMPGRGYIYYSSRSEMVSFVFAQPFSSVVATATPTDITAVSAVVGGVVMLPEGSHVYLRGVCWSTEPNPDIDGSHTTEGMGIGSFTTTLDGLTPNTTYFVRAYAVSDYGLAYGNVMSFTTLSGMPIPEVNTTEVTDITATSATCGGTVVADESLAIIARGVCWSTSSNPTISDSHTNDGTGTGSFVSTLTGLTSNTTYYVRAYATTAQATTYGEELSFTTSDGVVVTTSEPMLITAISAMCGGEVTVSDGTYILVKGLCWAAHENPTTNDDFFEEAESGVGSFSISMTDLNIGTTYYVRAYAVTPNGTVYGDQKTFTTRDGIPEVSTDSVMRILASFATCNGTVTDNGGLDVIARGVCWSTIHNPTINDDHSINGLGLGSFSGEISGLSPSTTYYVRAYASTSYSTGYGEEMSFTTQGSSAGQYVDLGLPTGTLWALCNAGAEAPEEYGGYYDEGSVPNLDADWRLPTKEEWQELLNNTTSIWTIQNDVNGRLYTASNGNSLFLPAAGYIWLSGSGALEEVGFVGYYWSSSFVWVDFDYYMYHHWYFGYSGYSGSNYFSYLSGDIIYLLPVRAVHRKPCVINVTANPTEGGMVSGGGTYLDGTNCTVSATANEGYTFTNWTENDEVVSTEATYSFTLDENKTLVANFTYVGGGDHTYVDLGLPSGTLWATCNVGADSPSDYGDYFAWGETQLKETYDWSTYQYCMGSYNTLTKYCYNPEYGYNGFTDNLTILLSEDDAATVNWGTDWRIPTNEEWQELYQNTTYTWATLNSITGILFTASNGNSLFLPLAGIREGSSLNYLGNVGRYLSSSLGTYRPYGAWLFNIDYLMEAYGCVMWDPNRHNGCSVRAVRSSAQSTAPTGAIDGKFTINASGDQVYFSQGNLQYIGSASTPYWKFADNQWDYLTGQNNSNQNVDRDHFGWGTSGYNHGAVCYQPWSTSTSDSAYYAYGKYSYNLNAKNGQADWGYNPISNGGNQPNQWRTLTGNEWQYIFNTRETNSGIRYAKANVNEVNGVILLPDNWESFFYMLNNTNSSDANFSSNVINTSEWSTLELYGAVFLLSAGFDGYYGEYWSSSYVNSSHAFSVSFRDTYLFPKIGDYRHNRVSVRLVRVVE